MSIHKRTKLNWLERNLPDGYLADAAWFERNGISRQLRSKYVANGWLVSPARGVYSRPQQTQADFAVPWMRLVISLNELLDIRVWIGGRTALELSGFGHYLSEENMREIHLYSYDTLPGWMHHLNLDARVIQHNARRLFERSVDVQSNGKSTEVLGAYTNSLTRLEATLPFLNTTGNRSIVVSSPERAILELLNEVPDRETFHQADALFEGLRNLSPTRLQPLLQDCRSVKVKRLLFWYAERHDHSWLNRLDRSKIDLGSGKRMLVRGGKLNTKYNITVPGNMDAVI